jgi:hypothetical protein
MPEELHNESFDAAGDKYERYDLELRRSGVGADRFSSDWMVSREGGMPVAYRSPNPGMGGGEDIGIQLLS